MTCRLTLFLLSGLPVLPEKSKCVISQSISILLPFHAVGQKNQWKANLRAARLCLLVWGGAICPIGKRKLDEHFFKILTEQGLEVIVALDFIYVQLATFN